MDFVVATESALGPRAYTSIQALAHFLKRGASLNRQSLMLRLVWHA